MSKIHDTAAAALNDPSNGLRRLSSLPEARKMHGIPARTRKGNPGRYLPPVERDGYWVVNVTAILTPNHRFFASEV